MLHFVDAFPQLLQPRQTELAATSVQPWLPPLSAPTHQGFAVVLVCYFLLSCEQVVMNGNQVPKLVEITQEAIDTGAEVRQGSSNLCSYSS
jgi:hypothetical protein